MKHKRNMSIISHAMILIIGILCIVPISPSIAEEYSIGRDMSNSIIKLDLKGLDENSSVNAGNNVKVRFEFDDSRGSFQEGDFIDIKWSTSQEGDGYFEGFLQEVPLKIEGKEQLHIADAVIEKNSARITFNSNVAGLQDVRGWGEFTLVARNDFSGKEENRAPVNVHAGSNISYGYVFKPQSGDKGVFYYKTGQMSVDHPNELWWFLNINNNKDEVAGDVRIEDQIQEGQQLDPNSFEIVVYDWDGSEKRYRGKNAVNNFENDFPGAYLYVYPEQNKLIVIIQKETIRLRMISIAYKTDITDSTKATYENKTQAWYQVWGEEPVERLEEDASVDNANADAGITGTVGGEFKVFKTIEGTDIPIEGVEFEIRRADNAPVRNDEVKVIIRTNGNGIANITKLRPGEYKVKEVHAPEWIDFDPIKAKEHTFFINADDTKGVYLPVENKRKTNTLTIEKQVQGKYGDKTKKFNFEIEVKNQDGTPVNGDFEYIGGINPDFRDESSAPQDGQISFINGKAEFKLSHGQQIAIKDLPYGSTYTVKEIEANQDNYITMYNGSKSQYGEGTLTQSEKLVIVNEKIHIPTTGVVDTGGYNYIGISMSILGITIGILISVFHYRKRGRRL